MTVKRISKGKYRADFRTGGTEGKRVIRLFKTKKAAVEFERSYLSVRVEGTDKRRLSELVAGWYELHGRALKSAEDTKKRLEKMVEKLGDPVAKEMPVAAVVRYRKARIESGIAAATLNRELQCLKGVYREARRMGLIDYDHDVCRVKRLFVEETELCYLTSGEIKRLLAECRKSRNASLYWVVRLALLTGARWKEANSVKRSDVAAGGVTFRKTKNGKLRFVPLSEGESRELVAVLEASGGFLECYSAFRSAVKRAGLRLPDGQLSHVLRHSFASHFMMNGGNVRVLQEILGHCSLNITMRYAHFSPVYLREAIAKNPLTESGQGKIMESANG